MPSRHRCRITATRRRIKCSRRPPPLVGDTETASAHDDYDRSNSGGDERINLAEDNDSDLDKQSAGQHANIGNFIPEYPGLQLGEDTENGDEDNEGDVDMMGMMGPQGHRLRETAAPQYGIPSQKEGGGNTTSLDPKI